MKFRKLFNNAYVAEYEDDRVMSNAFMRFQEHYESPKFKGEIFTKSEFIQWYENKYKTDYLDDWGGFNLPDYIFNSFLTGHFDPLDDLEKELLENIVQIKGPKYYIVGAIKGDKDAIKHETAHGMFYLSHQYRTIALALMATYDTEAIQKHLLENGYCEDVIMDEVHAYALIEREYLEDNDLWSDEIDYLSKVLNKNYEIGLEQIG